MKPNNLADSNAFILFLGGVIAIAPLAMDVYLPAIPVMADFFNRSVVTVNMTISAYLIGNAIGQIIGGAFSDQMGRKPVGLLGLALFAICTLLITVAGTMELVLVLRVIQGIAGGATTVACIAQVRDIYPPAELPRRYASVFLIMLLAPIIAPALGSFLMQFSWQAIFLFLASYATVYFVIYCLFVPEVHTVDTPSFTVKTLFGNYAAVLNHKINNIRLANQYLLLNVFCTGVFITYLINSASIYMQHYQQSHYHFALLFSFGAVAIMAGNRFIAFFGKKIDNHHLLKIANLVQISASSLIVLLFVLRLETLYLVVPLIYCILACHGAMNPTLSGIYIGLFNKNIGSASAVNVCAIQMGGACIGIIAGLLSHQSVLPLFITMLIASLLTFIMLRKLRRYS